MEGDFSPVYVCLPYEGRSILMALPDDALALPPNDSRSVCIVLVRGSRSPGLLWNRISGLRVSGDIR